MVFSGGSLRELPEPNPASTLNVIEMLAHATSRLLVLDLPRMVMEERYGVGFPLI